MQVIYYHYYYYFYHMLLIPLQFRLLNVYIYVDDDAGVMHDNMHILHSYICTVLLHLFLLRFPSFFFFFFFFFFFD